MLIGRHIVKAHDKNIFKLPTNIISGQFVLTQGFEQNLLLIHKNDFELMIRNLGNLSITDPTVRLLLRLMLSNAIEAQIDQAIGLHIPENLARFSHISSQITLVGQGNYFEIWATEIWKDQDSRLQDACANASQFLSFHINFTQS